MQPLSKAIQDIIASETSQTLLLMSLIGEPEFKQAARLELYNRRRLRHYRNDTVAEFLIPSA